MCVFRQPRTRAFGRARQLVGAAGSNRELKLDLTQAVCTGKGDNNEIYNLKASDLKFNKIVTVKDE